MQKFEWRGFAEFKVPHTVRNDSYLGGVSIGFATTNPHPRKNRKSFVISSTNTPRAA